MVKYCKETRNRIRLSVAAYAYEYHDNSIMSDAEFDSLSEKINPEFKTKYRKLNTFFKKHFNPATGMWIRKHPDKAGLENLYQRYYNKSSEWYEGAQNDKNI